MFVIIRKRVFKNLKICKKWGIDKVRLILSDVALNDIENLLSDDDVYINVLEQTISRCIGCFNCWVKTPGKCVIRDDAPKIYSAIAKSKEVIYISKVKYGGYDAPMKTLLERILPTQQAFIRLHHNEVHHYQRDVSLKRATIIAYDAVSKEEKTVFSALVNRNAYNMNFESHSVIFTTKEELSVSVKREVLKWKK